jgi:hypothetical protein
MVSHRNNATQEGASGSGSNSYFKEFAQRVKSKHFLLNYHASIVELPFCVLPGAKSSGLLIGPECCSCYSLVTAGVGGCDILLCCLCFCHCMMYMFTATAISTIAATLPLLLPKPLVTNHLPVLGARSLSPAPAQQSVTGGGRQSDW